MKSIKEIKEEEAMCRYEKAIFFHNGKVACLAGDFTSGYKITEIMTIESRISRKVTGEAAFCFG